MPPASKLTTATVAARIPYANAAPFYALWKDAPFAVRNLVPRELGREAEAGGVDLGLMATGDYLRLRDRFELSGRSPPAWSGVPSLHSRPASFTPRSCASLPKPTCSRWS